MPKNSRCHEQAERRDQQVYRSSVAAIIGVLLLAALTTATSSILLPVSKSFKVFAAVFDVMGLLLAIVLFLVARDAIRKFSARRGLTELARAWMHAAIVFRIGDGDPVSELRSYVASVSKEVDRAPFWSSRRHSSVDRLIVQRWRTFLESLHNTPGREDKVQSFFSFYIWERPVEQLLYMRKARNRLEGSAHSREGGVLLLYLFTLMVAVLKVVVVFGALPNALLLVPRFNDPNLFSLLLIALLLTGAAITNYAISQGERSLSHSYFIHEQRIYDWLRARELAQNVTPDQPQRLQSLSSR